MIAPSPPAPGRLRAGGTLDDVLRAWADDGHDGAPCLLCDGETFPVLRRNGATAVVCRSCGTSVEDGDLSTGLVGARRSGERAELRVA